ncbi:MAG: SUMF1/EgtB/PvdO family nonheme iron enzyme [Chloroflexota bacterium]
MRKQLKRYLGLALILLTMACTIHPITPDDVPLVYIPAGAFLMGSHPSEPGSGPDEYPQHTVMLDAFWMDQTEVTNERYQRCVAAEACRPIITPRDDFYTQPDFPVQGVAWPEAVAYCRWVGRRLPTEAEWKKAARGTAGQRFPWGDSVHSVLNQWQQQKKHNEAQIALVEGLAKRKQQLYDEQKRQFGRLDRYLDTAEYGPTWLSNPQLAQLVADSMHFYDGEKYRLPIE